MFQGTSHGSIVRHKCWNQCVLETHDDTETLYDRKCLSNERCCWKCSQSNKYYDFENGCWKLISCYMHPSVGGQSSVDAYCNDFTKGISRDVAKFEEYISKTKAEIEATERKKSIEELRTYFGYIE